jgi:hypothetical protein
VCDCVQAKSERKKSKEIYKLMDCFENIVYLSEGPPIFTGVASCKFCKNVYKFTYDDDSLTEKWVPKESIKLESISK